MITLSWKYIPVSVSSSLLCLLLSILTVEPGSRLAQKVKLYFNVKSSSKSLYEIQDEQHFLLLFWELFSVINRDGAVCSCYPSWDPFYYLRSFLFTCSKTWCMWMFFLWKLWKHNLNLEVFSEKLLSQVFTIFI